MLLLKELRNCILRTIFVWSLLYWIWAYTSLHFLSVLLGNYFFLSFCAFCVYCLFWFRRTLYSLNKKHASRELLSFNNFIYKENCGTFRKWQSVKEALSAYDFFLGNLRSKSWNFAISIIVILLWRQRTQNTDFFQNTCLKERSNMAVAPSLRVTIYLCKKYCLQLSHGIKKIHRSKLYQW